MMNFNFLKTDIPESVKFILKIAVSFAILFLILYKIDERLLLSIIMKANPMWIIWSLAWFAFSKILSAQRLNILLKTEHIFLTFKDNLKLYWLCMYYNLLLPGGISGDAYKIKVLMDGFKQSFKKLFGLILIDRISGLLALVFLALLMVLIIPEFNIHWLLYSILFILLFSILFNVFQWKDHVVMSVWRKTSMYSLVVQLSQLIATIGLVFALGIDQKEISYLLLFMLSSVIAMLPITIGGAGARELTFLYGSQVFGLNSELAVAIGFLFYLISNAVSLTGIYYSFHKDFLSKLKPE